MAPHSSTPAWKIPWTEEPGRLQSMGSRSRTRLSDFTFTFHFHALRRKWQPPPVFLPGESQGWGIDCMDHNKLWKILKDMGIPEQLICLLRNLYAGQEAAVRTGHGTTDWFQIGKGVYQDCTLLPCFFNLYAEYIMRNAGLEETQIGLNLSQHQGLFK